MNSVSTPATHAAAAPGDASFPVKFIPYREQTLWKPKFDASWRWAGRATITFSSGELTIRGKRRGPFGFGRKQEVRVALLDLVNVVHDGKTVHCEVRADGRRNRPLDFSTTTEEDARAIVARCPTEQTPEFASARTDQVAFKAALDATGTRAIVTPVLVGLNVIAYAAMVAGGVNALDPNGYSLIPWGSNFGPRTLNGEWWRLFTSMFLHFGLVHLLLNMWTLWSIGRLAEKLFGSLPYALLYMAAGLAGSLASLLWNPDVNSAGASGAIFGVIGGLLAFMLNPRTRLPASIAAAQRKSLVVFIAYNLLNGVTHAGIDNACHLGGLLSGLAMGWILAAPLDPERRLDTSSRLGSWLGVTTTIIAGLWWPLEHPTARQISDRRFQADIPWIAEKEHASATTIQSLEQRRKNRQITEREEAERIRAEVEPLWLEMHERLQDTQLLPGSRFLTLQNALITFVNSRKLALELTDEAVLENNAVKREWADEVMKHSVAHAGEVRQAMNDLH